MIPVQRPPTSLRDLQPITRPIGPPAQSGGGEDLLTQAVDDPPAWLPETEREFADRNSGLVDELEQILRGFSAAEDDEPLSLDQRSEAAFPLAEPDDDQWISEPPIDFDDVKISPPEPDFDDYPVPVDAERHPDEEPPISAAFWSAEMDAADGPDIERSSLARPRDFLILGFLVFLIAGGGAYSALQLSNRTVVADDGQTALARDESVPASESAPAAAPEEPVVEAIDPAVALRTAGMLQTPAAFAPTPDASAAIGGPFVADPGAPQALVAAELEPRVVRLVEIGPPPPDEPALVAESSPPPPAAPQEQEPEPPTTTPGTAKVYVNMRAGPDNDATIISVLAAGTAVEIVDCNFWCQVVVDGVEGWIYQDFLNVGGP